MKTIAVFPTIVLSLVALRAMLPADAEKRVADYNAGTVSLPTLTLPKDFGPTGRAYLIPLTTLTVWLCEPGAPRCAQNGSALAQTFVFDLAGCERQFAEQWGDAPPGAIVRHRCEINGFNI